jgi:general secretion pathway protein C
MSKPTWLRASTWLTLLAWALVAASAVYWYFSTQSVSQGPGIVSAPATSAAAPEATAMGRLLGYRPSAAATNPGTNTLVSAPASSRFALHGVLYQARGGVALIAADGKPAKHYRVGAEVDSGLVLQSVARRSATLGPAGGDATFTLELPAPTVMVSSTASPALSSRPLVPGTPPTSTMSAAPAARAVAQPILSPSSVGVQVPGMGGVPAEATTERPGARGGALRGLMQGAAGITGGGAAPGTAPGAENASEAQSNN